MKNFLLFFSLFLIPLTLIQAADPEKYDWQNDRKKYNVSAEEQNISALVLKEKKVIEYFFETPKDLVVYKTFHKIILVNTSEAIDLFNKVYIQVEGPNSLISIKARSFNKNGKVTMLDKNSLKEVQNMEDLGTFKIFAIEGLEAGSEIEYIYTIKRSMNLFGREYLQSTFPSKDVSFDLISPSHLQFEAKAYNGLPDFKDTLINQKRFLSLQVESIPAAVEEEYSVYEANLKRIDYKLAYNKESSSSRLLTWDNAGERIYSQISVINSKEESKMKKLCKSQKFYNLPDKESKIRAVENYIKSNFLIRKGDSEDFILLDKIIANKYGDELGILRLFEAIFNELGIEHQIVLTSDRSDSKFDGNFDTWKFLEHYVMYFPFSEKYMAPTQMEMRYGMIPFYWTNNEGLFILKKPSVSAKPFSEIKFIPALPAGNSVDNIYAYVDFSEDMDNVNVDVTRKIGGYNAMNFQPYYHLLDKEKQGQLNDELMKFISKDSEISNVKVENTDPNKSSIDFPFIITGNIKLSSLIEKAGNKYFFKVGDVIGRQSELYSDKKRVHNVENDFNRVYIRQIKVKIPQGYVIKNLDDIKKNVSYDENGKRSMGFVSTYKMEGDMLIIDIDESYNKIDFPLSMYEDFRKVINAAADFNKVVLIMEKAN